MQRILTLVDAVLHEYGQTCHLLLPSKEKKTVSVDGRTNAKPSAGYSFIHSGHFYSTPSSPLPLRGASDYSTDTVSEFHAEAHRQLQIKDLPKVPKWRLERESNPRPSVIVSTKAPPCPTDMCDEVF